jgi:hypothetical protein
MQTLSSLSKISSRTFVCQSNPSSASFKKKLIIRSKMNALYSLVTIFAKRRKIQRRKALSHKYLEKMIKENQF